MSKAFDKVWHKGLLFKIETFGISNNIFYILQSFLSNRFQRVSFNGLNSGWKNVGAGVPQGSILGPLFFLMYVNDLPQGLTSIVKLFVDNVSIFSFPDNIYILQKC